MGEYVETLLDYKNNYKNSEIFLSRLVFMGQEELQDCFFTKDFWRSLLCVIEENNYSCWCSVINIYKCFFKEHWNLSKDIVFSMVCRSNNENGYISPRKKLENFSEGEIKNPPCFSEKIGKNKEDDMLEEMKHPLNLDKMKYKVGREKLKNSALIMTFLLT